MGNKYKAQRTNGFCDIFGGRYRVYDNGLIYSLRFKNRMIDKERSGPLLLKPARRRRGYLHVTLQTGSGFKTFHVAALVLLAFVSPRPSGHHAAHKDGDPGNNVRSNLYWATPKQNQDDRKRHGRRQVGEQVKTAKLRERQVKEIFHRRRSGDKQKDLAKEFGVSKQTVYLITSGRYWGHLGLK